MGGKLVETVVRTNISAVHSLISKDKTTNPGLLKNLSLLGRRFFNGTDFIGLIRS